METTLQNELGLLFTKMEMLSEGSADLSAMASGFSDMSEGLGTIYERRDTLHAGLPSEQSTLKAMAYKDDGGLRTVFESMIVKDTYALFTVSMKGSDEEASKAVIDTLDAHIEDSDYSGERLLSGKSVLDVSIKDSMKGSLPELLALAVGVMIALLIVFFKVRWRILPLITTMLAVVVTIGLMGYLGVPITMVSMAVFPILIGLGIDYAIEFQNRYTELLEEATHENV
jgi:predicted RND superfamily exporter protein